MEKFSLKYYPPKILIFLVALLLTFIFLIRFFISSFKEENLELWQEAFILITSSGIVSLIIFFINKYVMWRWLLLVLHLPDLRGTYEGKLTSSYHIDDDPNKPHVTKFVVLQIYQNLNGFYIHSKYYDHNRNTDATSESYSLTHSIVRRNDESFTIQYLYTNDPNTLHKTHRKVLLNTHQGFCILHFDPERKSLTGTYFNDTAARPSHGSLNLIKKNA